MERYLRSVQSQKVVRLLFIRSQAGLLEDKKRCKIVIRRCVMFKSGAGKDVERILVMCGEF